MRRFTHIVNPVNVPSTSDLFVAQPITFESLKRAKDFAGESVYVDQVTAQFPEDHKIIPEFLSRTNDLQRSVLDIGNFSKQRKLPFIKDILDNAFGYSDSSDFIIYTNVDIAVMPYFYLFIDRRIEEGADALIINRRTISTNFSSVERLSFLYSELGQSHPGYDCFVFKRSSYLKFILGNACIGANWIGRVLYANLMTFSDSLYIEQDRHVTFHIGEDGAWLSGQYNDYDDFNKVEAFKVLQSLLQSTDQEKKRSKLNEVSDFMSNWGKVQQIRNKKNFKSLLIKKLKQYLR